MKTPKAFIKPFGVLNIAMAIIVVLYSGMGLCGYIRFGDEIKGSITLNLPDEEKLGKAVQILLALAMFFTHPIQCYVAIDIAWNEYISSYVNKYQLFWEYVVRTVVILLTCKHFVLVPVEKLLNSLRITA